MYLNYLYRRLRLRWLYLSITLGALVLASVIVEVETTDSFNRAVFSVAKDVSNRAELFANTLYAYRGLYAASEEVTHEEWDLYNSSINENERFGSNILLSYLEVLTTDELDENTDYQQLSDLDYHYIIKYSRNSAEGLDLTSNIDRLEAMNKARDTGLIRATPPILALDTGEPAILLFQALYDISMPRSTLEERIAANNAFIAFYIPTNDIVSELFLLEDTEDIKLEISDIDSGRVIYSNGTPERFNLVSKTIDIEIGDRLWEVKFENYRTNYFKFSHLMMLIFVTVVGVYLTTDIYVLRTGIKEYKSLLRTS